MQEHRSRQYSLAALAAALLTMPALAHAQSATLYGRLDSDLETIKVSKGDNDVTRVSSNSSRFGIKGKEDLGGGLSAWYQVESSINVDAGGGTLAGRNTGVGLKGGWGTVMLGRWDSPYKLSTLRLDPFGITTIAGAQNIFGQMSGPDTPDFDRRVTNGVQYWSPDWNGLAFRLAYGAGESAGPLKPNVLSVSAAYDRKPFYVALAYEKHQDAQTLAAGPGDDTGTRVGVGYRFAHTDVGLAYERLRYSTAGAGDLQRNAWLASVKHRFSDQVYVRATYLKAGDRSGSYTGPDGAGPETGASGINLGVSYVFSKRTEVYALYARLRNDENVAYNYGVNSLKNVPTGATLSGFGVGIKHSF